MLVTSCYGELEILLAELSYFVIVGLVSNENVS